ncbi:hypothetical protein VSH64_11560 [Amycolatopsis rhabdoformis]|uniref:Class I SAM-dependent methyltransferase n=1 Tax=Amycolatopsis rhabdoformis TaxID=1448059 RepID=A0ABZ1IF61_9PSEU|nr:hypothetical protein [Amycolatopsis rhabdoformis]WSE32739.1 hypothetical protein VSH64_11560 [Amycolatopsis rhabdoformis]
MAIRHSTPSTGPSPVIRKVSPRRDALVVSLAEGAAQARFFRALLAPLEPTEGRDGIPGLRFDFAGPNLMLRLLDVDGRLTTSRVVLRGVSADSWTGMWATLRSTVYGGKCVDPLLDRSPKLSSGERHGYDFHWQHCGPVGLGSALLRRIGLVAGAAGLDVWSGLGGTVLHLETQRGPSVHSLVERLRHPVAGMIHGDLELDLTRGPFDAASTFAKIVDHTPTPDRFVGRLREQGKPPALALRTLDAGAHR